MTARLEPPVPSRAGRSAPPVLALCLLLGTAALPGALLGCGDARADADAIRSLVNREVAAINGKDLRALSEVWSKDKDILMFDVPPPGRFQGWDQIGRLWKDFFDKVSEIHLTVDALQAEAQGSLGYATYDWSMTGRLGSYALEDRGQATAIYRKEGGQWRLIHAHYSPVPPALAGQEKPALPAGGATPRPGAAATPVTPSPSPAGGASPAPGQAPKTP
jgi:ketosteroid isomerase-like protein